ncbi:MAG: hypothetical protein LBC02_05200 [Planctomycetaceae bacterium]|jgi:hypothetical protein|nr:hypothetical protein [Planctomycetaceae bacterium]
MKIHFLFCIAILFVTILGCSSQQLPEDLPVLYPCKITVIQDGQPLAGASVILQLTENVSAHGGKSWIPMGLTDENGVAVMKTNARYNGAPLGKYKILVNKTEREPSKLEPAPPEDSPLYTKWLEKSQEEKLYEFGLVEAIYTDAQKTPHDIEITKNTNQKNVDVGKTVRNKITTP